MRQPNVNETFSTPGIRAYLHCSGELCALDLYVEVRDATPYDEAHVDVIVQPRDVSGMPYGNPAVLLDTDVTLTSVPGDELQAARVRLPIGVGPATARDCYYRVSIEERTDGHLGPLATRRPRKQHEQFPDDSNDHGTAV
ncbi:MAG: hypothetical protein HYV60_08690 [Planctomycetia bacterium]|nr:hypothetical protein [Planctomycetia bacterium]